MKRKSLLALSLILMFGLMASAHDTWLLPRQTTIVPGAMVRLDLTSGMLFPALDYSIKPDRIDVARCRLNGKTFAITQLASAPKSLALRVRLMDPGSATLWVELKPKSLELNPKQVQEYFDEINAPPAFRKSWEETKEPKRWRETYTKHAKTFVKVGDASDNSWAEPVGMALEIVPETDPTKLRAGADLTVRVLKDGAPLPHFTLGKVREGNVLSEFRETDAEGRVTFRLARSGQWLLRGTDLRRSTQPETEWESHFTTLTIAVAK